MQGGPALYEPSHTVAVHCGGGTDDGMLNICTDYSNNTDGDGGGGSPIVCKELYTTPSLQYTHCGCGITLHIIMRGNDRNNGNDKAKREGSLDSDSSHGDSSPDDAPQGGVGDDFMRLDDAPAMVRYLIGDDASITQCTDRLVELQHVHGETKVVEGNAEKYTVASWGHFVRQYGAALAASGDDPGNERKRFFFMEHVHDMIVHKAHKDIVARDAATTIGQHDTLTIDGGMVAMATIGILHVVKMPQCLVVCTDHPLVVDDIPSRDRHQERGANVVSGFHVQVMRRALRDFCRENNACLVAVDAVVSGYKKENECGSLSCAWLMYTPGCDDEERKKILLCSIEQCITNQLHCS